MLNALKLPSFNLETSHYLIIILLISLLGILEVSEWLPTILW